MSTWYNPFSWGWRATARRPDCSGTVLDPVTLKEYCLEELVVTPSGELITPPEAERRQRGARPRQIDVVYTGPGASSVARTFQQRARTAAARQAAAGYTPPSSAPTMPDIAGRTPGAMAGSVAAGALVPPGGAMPGALRGLVGTTTEQPTGMTTYTMDRDRRLLWLIAAVVAVLFLLYWRK